MNPDMSPFHRIRYGKGDWSFRLKSFSLILTAALFAFVISSCSANSAENNAKEAEKPIAVSVEDIKKNTIEKVQTLTGKAKPEKDINIVSKVAGKVIKVYATVGDEVKKGQILFSIDDKDIKLQVKQSEAALNLARSNLDRTKGGASELQLAQLESSFKTAEINYNDAKKAYEDTKALYEKGSVSKQNYDAAETRFKVAAEQYNTARKAWDLTETKINKENIAAAEAQYKQAAAAYELAKSQLDNTNVTSPIEGIVSVIGIEEGEMVSGAMAAASVVDISSVVIEVNVMEDMINKLSTGDRYEVVIKSAAPEPFKGEVISISPNVDPRTQTYLVKIRVKNVNKMIKGGMIAEVKIVTGTKENAVTVPLEAVVNQNGKKVIYIVSGDRAVAKEVTTGVQGDKYIEVLGDMNEGDRVIVKGQNFVKDQSLINIVD